MSDPTQEALRAKLGLRAIREQAVEGSISDKLVDELVNGETYFFREPEQLAYLEQRIIPEILGHRPKDHHLRLWSAGCASGEEAYTLAIILERSGLLGRASILATDLSPRHLARAVEAKYRPWSFRGVSELVIASCFDRHGEHLTPKPHLRAAVRFERHNLLDGNASPFREPFDVILLRNVLIHLEPEAHAPIAERLFDRLAPGGYLVTGASDPSLESLAPFEVTLEPFGLLHKKPVEGPRVTPKLESISGTETSWTNDQIRALAGKKRHEEALAQAELALRDRPLDAELHVVRGEILLELRRNDEAAETLRRALYLDRTHAIARRLLDLAQKRSRR